MRANIITASILAAFLGTSALAETITSTGTVGNTTSCTIDNITDGTLAVGGLQNRNLGTGYVGGVDPTVTVTASDDSFKLAVSEEPSEITFTAANGGVWPTEINSVAVLFADATGTLNASDSAFINGTLQAASSMTLASGTSTLNIRTQYIGVSGWTWTNGDYTMIQGVSCVPQ